jgi:CBS domain-containing protein
MTVETILNTKGHAVFTIVETETLLLASRSLDKHGVGALVVVDAAGRPIAVVSERDVVREIALSGAAALQRPVAHIMTQAFITASPEESLEMLMYRMTSRRVRHIPVIHEDVLIGIVSIGDIVKAKIDHAEAETLAIREYILS